jgi:hypothetical protein
MGSRDAEEVKGRDKKPARCGRYEGKGNGNRKGKSGGRL